MAHVSHVKRGGVCHLQQLTWLPREFVVLFLLDERQLVVRCTSIAEVTVFIETNV